jgi:hypothetical protein
MPAFPPSTAPNAQDQNILPVPAILAATGRLSKMEAIGTVTVSSQGNFKQPSLKD